MTDPTPMTFALGTGISISLDNSTWYDLTDHNRGDIKSNTELIEKSQRMANGIMRKYVVAQKDKISTSWTMLPSKTALAVDGKKSVAWLEAFYSANVGLPIYVKVRKSKETVPSLGSVPNDSTFASASTSTIIYSAFITNFSTTIVKRTSSADYVDMDIEFTEI